MKRIFLTCVIQVSVSERPAYLEVLILMMEIPLAVYRLWYLALIFQLGTTPAVSIFSLWGFFVLSGIHPIVFSGRIYHGGTAPLAPANVTKIEPWAYRFVMIFCPASRIITGTTQPFMASSGILGRGLNLPCETFGYEYVSPDSVFFLF